MVRSGPLRRLLLCIVLGFGAMMGMPMRPDEVERLLRAMSQPRVARVLPDAGRQGDE